MLFPTECHPNLLVSHERVKAKDWKTWTIHNSVHEFRIDSSQKLAEFLLEYASTE
jgi:hypothetical protein